LPYELFFFFLLTHGACLSFTFGDKMAALAPVSLDPKNGWCSTYM